MQASKKLLKKIANKKIIQKYGPLLMWDLISTFKDYFS